MDTLAHGLWGGVAFGRQSKPHYWMAFVLGMMPDLLSFGPFFIMWAFHGFAGRTPGEPPDPALIPAYVYQAYNVTHSLVIWSSMAVISAEFLKSRSSGRVTIGNIEISSGRPDCSRCA
jgi:hypothetical protein